MGKKICKNCEQVIGNLEESYSYQDNIVCKACKMLLEEESQVIEVVESNVETKIPTAKILPQAGADKGLSKAALWSLLVVGCLLHILFSAEGVFHGWSWDYPFYCFSIMAAYATPGVLVSIAFIPPFIRYFLTKPRPKIYKMEHVVLSVYLGFAIRMLMHRVY